MGRERELEAAAEAEAVQRDDRRAGEVLDAVEDRVGLKEPGRQLFLAPLEVAEELGDVGADDEDVLAARHEEPLRGRLRQALHDLLQLTHRQGVELVDGVGLQVELQLDEASVQRKGLNCLSFVLHPPLLLLPGASGIGSESVHDHIRRAAAKAPKNEPPLISGTPGGLVYVLHSAGPGAPRSPPFEPGRARRTPGRRLRISLPIFENRKGGSPCPSFRPKRRPSLSSPRCSGPRPRGRRRRGNAGAPSSPCRARPGPEETPSERRSAATSKGPSRRAAGPGPSSTRSSSTRSSRTRPFPNASPPGRPRTTSRASPSSSRSSSAFTGPRRGPSRRRPRRS